ncbi:alpha-hydroxy acid oxidase [Streptomyces rishiriensis]|uniref:alpha-hydroxy acid oxidase n=1 Tax=Streptomyces rishiriensis TaxID=68264 RepID=UPI0037D22A61
MSVGAIRFALPKQGRPISIAGYRTAARRVLPDLVWAYVENGADDSVTLAANRSAFARWSLRQRVLRSSAGRKTAARFGDTELAIPVMIAPTGINGLVHWRGELATACGAAAAGSRIVLSTAASYSVEEVAEASPVGHWLQVYPWRDRELMDWLLERGRRSDCPTLVVTVDTPVFGNREPERLQGMSIPPVLTPRHVLDAALHPRWAYKVLRHQRVFTGNLVGMSGVRAGALAAKVRRERMMAGELDWDDFARVRAQWQGLCYVKGILDADDAERAVSLGADGIIVSNHGGRQLDGAPATLDALPVIADRLAHRATVLIDGGIRRGTDVVKALCLGADGCLIGRPALYGLAVGGESGVEHVLNILREEIDRTLALMGCSDIADLGRDWLIPG